MDFLPHARSTHSDELTDLDCRGCREGYGVYEGLRIIGDYNNFGKIKKLSSVTDALQAKYFFHLRKSFGKAAEDFKRGYNME